MMITLTDEEGKKVLLNPDHIVGVFPDTYKTRKSQVLLTHANIPYIFVRDDLEAIQTKIDSLYE